MILSALLTILFPPLLIVSTIGLIYFWRHASFRRLFTPYLAITISVMLLYVALGVDTGYHL